MKKDYKKPTMEIINVEHSSALLVGSGDGYRGYGAYIPGDATDMNSMA